MSTAKCTSAELHDLRERAGKLTLLGHAVLLPACLVAKMLQELTPDLCVHHLALANNKMRALKNLQPTLTFICPSKPPATSQCIIQTFADASTGSAAYGLIVVVPGFLLPSGVDRTTKSSTIFFLRALNRCESRFRPSVPKYLQ